MQYLWNQLGLASDKFAKVDSFGCLEGKGKNLDTSRIKCPKLNVYEINLC